MANEPNMESGPEIQPAPCQRHTPTSSPSASICYGKPRDLRVSRAQLHIACRRSNTSWAIDMQATGVSWFAYLIPPAVQFLTNRLRLMSRRCSHMCASLSYCSLKLLIDDFSALVTEDSQDLSSMRALHLFADIDLWVS